MSFRARMQRIAFIHRRLEYKRDYPSARELTEDYLEETGDEFSARTFKRDIEWLRDQQAPLEYEVQRHGYHYTDDTYQLPTVMLSEGDLLAVLVTERALSSYRKPGHTSSAFRVIAPYHIGGFRGEWYLIAYSHHDAEIRIYALGRFTGAKATRDCFQDRFQAPAHFDPAAYIDPAFGVFLGGEQTEISVHFDAAVASKIRERQWHPNQVIEDTGDGGIILRFRTNQSQQTLFWVSQWGPNAEILQPADLRRQAAAWMEDAAARYRDPA